MTHTETIFFSTTALGLEDLLEAELKAQGAKHTKIHTAGVAFQGGLEVAYRACLWSRVANRVLLPLATLPAVTPEALYQGAREIPWEEHFQTDQTFAVDASLSRSELQHSQYAAQVVKDAVVDRFKEQVDQRPSVSRERPDLQLYLHVRNDQATLGIDLSGESLHQRGYRLQGGKAPLKENLASGILARLRWPTAFQGKPLVDPMCGSGTLLVEGARMAADIAPGLERTYFGFLGWARHQSELWQSLLTEAEKRKAEGLAVLPPIIGQDQDPRVMAMARDNIRSAGLEGYVEVRVGRLEEFSPPDEAGLLVSNPPYGERLGEENALRGLYGRIGDLLKTRFSGWRAGIFTGNAELGHCLGLRARRMNNLYNGAIKCVLLHLDVAERWFFQPIATAASTADLGEGAQALSNRLRKNRKKLAKWKKQAGIHCYRLYDADLPEYAMAIDIYGDWAHVQEYAPPKDIPPQKAQRRVQEAQVAVAEVLEIPREQIVLKVRQRQRGKEQYQRQDQKGERLQVEEHGCRFWVNLTDYLDTGLFLDHRPVRRWMQQQAKGKRFLNLFCYTGAVTVHAAVGGARETVSVDLSKTYLDWAQDNLRLNGILAGPGHQLVRGDCLQWLKKSKETFDLIFLDPPTFSNSKKMADTLDVQRDHVELVRLAYARLAHGGTLIFSTNQRKFRLDGQTLADLEPEEITPETIDPDFARTPKFHQCWRFCRP